MFSRVAVASLLALPLLAAANDCNTGPIQCCKSVQKGNSAEAGKILGPLDIVWQNLNVLVGIGCSPITVIGAGGGSCNAQAVCCKDNSHGGLISIGCVPVKL